MRFTWIENGGRSSNGEQDRAGNKGKIQRKTGITRKLNRKVGAVGKEKRCKRRKDEDPIIIFWADGV